jgi:hypothetical protein
MQYSMGTNQSISLFRKNSVHIYHTYQSALQATDPNQNGAALVHLKPKMLLILKHIIDYESQKRIWRTLVESDLHNGERVTENLVSSSAHMQWILDLESSFMVFIKFENTEL